MFLASQSNVCVCGSENWGWIPKINIDNPKTFG